MKKQKVFRFTLSKKITTVLQTAITGDIMSETPLTITLVGCGNMGGAMLNGWLKNMSKDTRFNVTDPNPPKGSLAENTQVTYGSNPAEIQDHIAQSDIVFFANKPQIMGQICKEWQSIMPEQATIAHICAGIPLAFLHPYFGAQRPYIRMMPNTPAAVGQGVTGIYANEHVTEDIARLAADLVTPLGESSNLKDEEQIDAITAVSGSGPAYIFYLAEFLEDRKAVIEWGKNQEEKQPFSDFTAAMIKGATALGFTAEQAKNLTSQTIKGAAIMLEAHPDIPAEQLRKNVTSPGGTTEAALNVMMQGDLFEPGKIEIAMKAANERAIELGKEQLAKTA